MAGRSRYPHGSFRRVTTCFSASDCVGQSAEQLLIVPVRNSATMTTGLKSGWPGKRE